MVRKSSPPGFRVEGRKLAYDTGAARVSASRRFTTFSVRLPLVGTVSKRIGHKRALRSLRKLF